MEICYKRDPRGSFMIIEGRPRKESYEDIMVRENNVKSILNSYSAEINSRLQYWYNISGKRSLRDYVDEERLTIDFVINLFEALSFAYGRLAKFLIDPAHIFLTPESLFLDTASENIAVYLCFMPLDKDGNRDGFSTITECLTEGIRTSARVPGEENDERQRMVELIYKLYDISLRDEYCLDRLISEVRKYEESVEIKKAEVLKNNMPEEPQYEKEIEEKEKVPKKKFSFGRKKENIDFDEGTGEEFENDFSQNDFSYESEEAIEDDFFEDDFYEEEERDVSSFFNRLKAKFLKEKDNEKAPEKVKEKVNAKENKKIKDKVKANKKGKKSHDLEEDPYGSSLKQKKIKAKERVEALVPKRDHDDFEDVDFIYNEDDEINEPTVLLANSDAKISGRMIYEGLEDESDFSINKDLVRIGSSENGNDIVLKSKVISRHHAKITREGGQYFIEDLNSTNGTTVNGELLSYKELVKLKKMDEIAFADVVYKII